VEVKAWFPGISLPRVMCARFQHRQGWTGGGPSGCLGRSQLAMTALPEDSIQRIAALQEWEHWWTPSANPVKSLPNSSVTACRGESLLKHLHHVQGDDRLGTFG
jgi:hypothetical protein